MVETVFRPKIFDVIDPRAAFAQLRYAAFEATGRIFQSLSPNFTINPNGSVSFEASNLRKPPPAKASLTAKNFNPFADMRTGLMRLFRLARKHGPQVLGNNGILLYGKLYLLWQRNRLGAVSFGWKDDTATHALWSGLPPKLRAIAIPVVETRERVDLIGNQPNPWAARRGNHSVLRGLASADPALQPTGPSLYKSAEPEAPVLVTVNGATAEELKLAGAMRRHGRRWGGYLLRMATLGVPDPSPTPTRRRRWVYDPKYPNDLMEPEPA